jgi:hypothetical protein
VDAAICDPLVALLLSDGAVALLRVGADDVIKCAEAPVKLAAGEVWGRRRTNF